VGLFDSWRLGMPRLRAVREHDWAGDLLEWRGAGGSLTAEVSCGVYFVAAGRHEVLAWCEVRDWGGKYRVEVGTFGDVAAAQAACERDAQARCRREEEVRPVDIRRSVLLRRRWVG
jgi:hypothetical protein